MCFKLNNDHYHRQLSSTSKVKHLYVSTTYLIILQTFAMLDAIESLGIQRNFLTVLSPSPSMTRWSKYCLIVCLITTQKIGPKYNIAKVRSTFPQLQNASWFHYIVRHDSCFASMTTCACSLVSVKQEQEEVFCSCNKKLTTLQQSSFSIFGRHQNACARCHSCGVKVA